MQRPDERPHGWERAVTGAPKECQPRAMPRNTAARETDPGPAHDLGSLVRPVAFRSPDACRAGGAASSPADGLGRIPGGRAWAENGLSRPLTFVSTASMLRCIIVAAQQEIESTATGDG